MKKYTIYRAPGKVDRDLGKHELVGVEYGGDIYAATDAILRAVRADLSENPEYEGCDAGAYAPEPMDESFRTKRYQYYVTGTVAPVRAFENILVGYGIIETEES